MRLPLDKAVSILKLLVEGMSVRSVERVTGVHRDTILRLLVLAGERCERMMQRKIEHLTVQDVEADEIWGFVQKKEGHKWPHEEDAQEIGDAYCFVAMERNTKTRIGVSRWQAWLSCHRFRGNEVRLWLSILAYNLGNLWRRLALPGGIEDWSLTSVQQRLVKTGGRLVKHARYYRLMLAEGHLTRGRFAAMLRRIAMLPLPAS
jgi:hypothetical protein